MRTGGRARIRWSRRLVRRTAVVVAAVMAVSLAGPQASLVPPGQDALPLSWLWSWFDLPAGWAAPPTPPTPVQESAGTAADRSHTASSASTRAGAGAGHAPGKGPGELDPYSPHQLPPAAQTTTGRKADDHSFDPAHSTRVAADATATSDVFANPDGSFTRRVYAGPHNFKAADGTWTPIDTTVAKQSDGRWHEHANAVGVDLAPSANDPALASVRLDASRAVAYGLQGAAKVAPVVSGSTATYPGVLAGTGLLLTTVPTGLKESLVLHSAMVATSWVFPLRLQ